jgi:hypothetical protein
MRAAATAWALLGALALATAAAAAPGDLDGSFSGDGWLRTLEVRSADNNYPPRAYSSSISFAYFSWIGLRFSFMVGVSSSPPGCQSWSSSLCLLIYSTRASWSLAASTPRSTSARSASRPCCCA